MAGSDSTDGWSRRDFGYGALILGEDGRVRVTLLGV
jgi:hypothetical protein